ncbi:hypothetical protein, variant 5 [Phytophthora nicotianae CJ01A1]|nr:hypothetical protein, variant 5 [Phytophthora nicotianae INRA-310]ETI56601.1 hypothetical protein, variant 5 [Phytophthora nicotianae P1569]ETK96388.1 hypothetical protein, variant 5 [Phytophthora nicotianae]ETO85330.1 hypothetical protein, variant 5 [Phytophthora nicotianae P1976]ETP26395.1 hypothetical protein, variant 5 [Phytophthora nicotianae CJ01A1]ETP54388.1 hypothetical protein, variant 5 [Phytophthora nicotianae P10297]
MQTGDQPDPELRGPKDIVVKVHAVALNPIDYKRRQGVLKMLLKEKWPHIIGYDFSGMVTNCGDSVDKFAVGDEVFGMLPHDSNGALADFVVVEAEYISKKPSNLTHVEAAALPLVTQTALQCFRLGQLAENKKVLITGGAGGAGSMAIQIAKTVFKAKTVATTASTKKLERMRLLGADEAVDYGHERFERELAEYDFAMDCTGEVAIRIFSVNTKQANPLVVLTRPSSVSSALHVVVQSSRSQRHRPGNPSQLVTSKV